jgi:hypothetical protein
MESKFPDIESAVLSGLCSDRYILTEAADESAVCSGRHCTLIICRSKELRTCMRTWLF